MNLVASMLELDVAAMRALRIRDLYSLHRVVYSLYPDIRTDEDKATGASSGILFANKGGDARARRILTLANRQPESVVDSRWGQVTTKPVPESFLSFRNYRFEVIVNPTKRDAKTRKRIALRTRDEIAKWFIARAPGWGFQTTEAAVDVGETRVHNFKDKAGHAVTLSQTQISGRLEVVDQDTFSKSFATGIGRGRAFGCGLLQLKPFAS